MFIKLIKNFSSLYFVSYIMSSKKQLSYLKKIKILVKQKKLKVKTDILREDTFVVFKDKLIGGL